MLAAGVVWLLAASIEPSPREHTAVTGSPDEPSATDDAALDGDDPSDDAAPRPTMLLWSDEAAVGDEAWASRIRRVRDELAALGVDSVVFMPPTPGGSNEAIVLEMQSHGATIALWIAGDRDRAELWRLAAGGDPSRLEHVAIITGDVGVSDEGATFAVRCAEIAHALSVEVAAASPERARPTASPTIDASVPAQGPRWDLRLGATVGGAARSVGPVLGPTLGGGVRFGARQRFGVDAELVATALRGAVQGEAGTARVGWAIARAHAVAWPIPAARVAPMVGVGGGTMVAWTRGRATTPFVGKTDVTAVGLMSVALDVAVRVASRARLRLGGRIGVALPALSIDTGGARRRTALPLGEAVLAVEIVPRATRRGIRERPAAAPSAAPR